MPGQLQFIDVFAGCGGLTQGFRAAGFVAAAVVERDPAAAATHRANFSEHGIYRDAESFAAGSVPRAEVVVGGPPCQGFSNLGQRRVNDPRNGLWRHVVEVVRKARPAVFLLENVPQFLSSAAFRELASTTARGGPLEGYRLTSASVVNAADYGAAQVRRRAIVIGTVGPALGLPEPTHGTEAGRAPWRTVRSAIGHLPPAPEVPGLARSTFVDEVPGPYGSGELHATPHLTELSRRRYASIPAGGSRLDLPDALKAACWLRPTRGSGDVLGRLHWDKPAVTVRTQFHKPETGRYLHPEAARPLTLHEGALLQGFPSEFRWCGRRSEIARQIGNAVPVPLAVALGAHIRQLFSSS